MENHTNPSNKTIGRIKASQTECHNDNATIEGEDDPMQTSLTAPISTDCDSLNKELEPLMLLEPADKSMPVIQRWYDMDESLSQLVRTLEHLSPGSQKLFATLLKKSSERLIKQRGRKFAQSLDWSTFEGIMKSRRSRRWYDQEPDLHAAFNTLLSLNDADKARIGKELNMSAQIVAGYEKYCKIQQNKIRLSLVKSIVETCLQEGPEKVIELFGAFL